MPRLQSLQVPAAKAAARTPQQKRFHTLIGQIEKARDLLAAWNENIPLYRQAHAQVLGPLRTELQQVHREWLFALDALGEHKGWTRPYRDTIDALICEGAADVLSSRSGEEDIKALFDKHSDVDFDTVQRERSLALKALAEEMTGVDLGDDHAFDEEVLVERMREGLAQKVAAEQARREARAAAKPKSAAQQKREAEAQQATQSVREIYRKLASMLHPDRVTDEGERAEKTALMQRVNQAYAASDLLALLELQLRIEGIDAGQIATAGDARLKHYNKVLAEQLQELRAEIEAARMAWLEEFVLPPLLECDPRRLVTVLDQTERDWRGELARLRNEIALFADAAATKRWLKRQRERLERDDFAFTV